MAVVEVIKSRDSRDKELTHLLRCLFFIAEHFHVVVEAVHMRGRENTRADALSRNNLSCFLRATPGADKAPVQIPSQLLMLLVEEQPDWMNWAQFV